MAKSKGHPWGAVAYRAYGVATGKKSLVSGEALPPWEALPPEMKVAWSASAVSVVEAYVAEDRAARRRIMAGEQEVWNGEY